MRRDHSTILPTHQFHWLGWRYRKNQIIESSCV